MVYSGIPFCIIFFSNIVILITLARASKIRAQSTQGSGIKGQHSMTIILIAVSITYIILSFPICVYFLIPGWNYKLETLYYVGLFCQYLNHSINFYIYLLTGSRFRAELKSLFWCCFKQENKSENSTVTETMSVSTVATANG